jgi:hypothetical protein
LSFDWFFSNLQVPGGWRLIQGWRVRDNLPPEKLGKAMSSVSAVNSLINGTTTNTPSINISSILAATSGNTAALDVTAAVAAGIYADRAPERVWEADQTTLTSQTTALTAIQTATTAVTTIWHR